MISRNLKEGYFLLMRIPMALNGTIYKHFRSPRTGPVKVHLGPGQTKYIAGWINLDANLITARLDVWADIRNGLPFRNNSVHAFYSYHVIEHLPDSFLFPHFREMFRCLKPGGLIRIGCPSGDAAIRKFIEGDAAWFGDWPDKRKSMGGRLANFLLCRGEHQSILTYSYLEEIAAAAGFTDLTRCSPRFETSQAGLIDERVLQTEEDDARDPPMSLVIEAVKPK